MWNSKAGIFFIFLVVLVSCKKQNITTVYTDDDYPTENAMGIFKTNFVSGDVNERILEIEFFQVSGIYSETDYSEYYLSTAATEFMTTTIDSFATITPAPIASYTNVLMAQTNGTYWMEYYKMSLGISKFCSEVAADPLKKMAMVTFQTGKAPGVKFVPTTQSIFAASADENKEHLFNDFVDNQEISYEGSEDEIVAAQLNQVLDSLILSPAVVGQKMITLIEDVENNDLLLTDSSLFDAIIEKAKLNNIQINLITNSEPRITHAKFAQKTGGFIVAPRGNNTGNYTENELLPTLGVFALNLDKLCTGNLYRHFFRLKLTFPNGASTFLSNEIIGFKLHYTNETFYIYSFED